MPDLRDAYRSLIANPVVTTVAVLSLALGIGANTAIFSIINALLLRPLPVREPERLLLITESGQDSASWTNPVWEQIRDRPDLFDGAFAWSSARFDLSSGGASNFVEGIWASGGFFKTLGVPTIVGRGFDEDDDARGGGPDGPVAVISYAFWQRHYGGAVDAIGRSIRLNGLTFTVVGVTPPEFFGPEVGEAFDVVIPIGVEPLLRGDESWLDRRSTWWLSIMARLKPGQTPVGATAALRGVQPQIREATLPSDWDPKDLKEYLNTPLEAHPMATGTSSLRRRYRRPLMALAILAGLTLLIACANVANLLLARSTTRRHELSVRLALGASRWRLARQLLVESLLLSGLGAATGMVLAIWGSRLLVGEFGSGRSEVFLDLSIDWSVLVYAAAAAVATAVLFGVAPALRTSRVEPIEALRERGRAVSERRVGMRLQNAFVIAQVTLSLIMIVAAGLFVRTYSALSDLDLGFDREPVLVVTLDAQRSASAAQDRPRLFESVAQALATVPGVVSAGASMVTPVSGSAWNTRLGAAIAPNLGERERTSWLNYVTPGWLSVLGTRLLAGRDLDDHDKTGSPHVVVVNEAFVNKFFNGEDPLGKSFQMDGRPGRERPWIEIVGVAADAVYRSVRDPVPPTMYLPMAQAEDLPPWAEISVRSAGPKPALLTGAVAEAIGRVDKDLSLTFRPLADQVNSSLRQERLVALLSAFFGTLALFLAGLGLYGVTAYAVNRRRFEIGVRMALGAAPGRVVGMVLRRVAWQLAIGFILGALAGLWATRFAESLLYGLQPHDPVTFAAAGLLLFAVGAGAGWLPARRAARIDPARVLREV